jgi:hypothetical protein
MFAWLLLLPTASPLLVHVVASVPATSPASSIAGPAMAHPICSFQDPACSSVAFFIAGEAPGVQAFAKPGHFLRLQNLGIFLRSMDMPIGSGCVVRGPAGWGRASR